MAGTISFELFRSELLAVLDETFDNVQGIYLDRNTSLFETLDTISAEEASQPVSATCASLAAQVAHVTFYLDTVIRYIETETNERVDWGEIWRTVEAVTPEQWEASKTALRATHQKLLALVKSYDKWDTEDAIGGAIGMVAHTAYHLGEIRQALCTLKQR